MEETEYEVTYTTSSGSGSFNGLFTAIDSLELVPQDPPHFNVEISETGGNYGEGYIKAELDISENDWFFEFCNYFN